MRTIYTVIIGPYDQLKQPFATSQHWEYICVTDQDFELPKDNVWKIMKVPVMDIGPAKTARWWKINFHKFIQTEESIFIDGTFFINIDLNRWWRRFSEPMTVINHPFDDCLYTDIKSCMSGGKGVFWDLVSQAKDYRDLGIPEHNGLISSGILMRKNTKEVRELCETWWSQVEKYSERDQVAFGYAAWKHPGVFNTIDWDYTQRKEFIHCPHNHKAWSKQKFDQTIKTYGGNKTH